MDDLIAYIEKFLVLSEQAKRLANADNISWEMKHDLILIDRHGVMQKLLSFPKWLQPSFISDGSYKDEVCEYIRKLGYIEEDARNVLAVIKGDGDGSTT